MGAKLRKTVSGALGFGTMT